MKSHTFIAVLQGMTDADAHVRERTADEVTDLLNSFDPAQAAAMATLLASAAVCEKTEAALEAELNAIVELTSTGNVTPWHLAPLREIDLTEIGPQLSQYVADLLEG